MRQESEHEEFFSEVYVDGTVCDLNNQKRTTEVRYICTNDKSSAILDVKEPYTCTYIMTIGSPLICKHPNYQPKKEKTQTIYCVPQDDQEVFETKLREVEEMLQDLNSFEDVEGEEETEEEDAIDDIVEDVDHNIVPSGVKFVVQTEEGEVVIQGLDQLLQLLVVEDEFTSEELDALKVQIQEELASKPLEEGEEIIVLLTDLEGLEDLEEEGGEEEGSEGQVGEEQKEKRAAGEIENL
jgi:hypothetical protein